MIDVKRLGHATFSTPDLDRQVEYWTGVMGLVCVHRDAHRAVLATRLGQEAVVLESGDHADLRRIAFQASADTDLDDVATALTRAGIASERRSCITPGIADAITFLDPRGTVVEIFTHSGFHPSDRGGERHRSLEDRPRRLPGAGCAQNGGFLHGGHGI